MAPKPSGIEIHLDKSRHLRFGLNALAALENELGASIQAVFSDIDRVGFTQIRGILWAGLLHEMPDLTVEKAGDLFEAIPEEVASTFPEKNEYLITKIGEAFGNDVESKKKSPRAAPAVAAS